MKSYGILPSRDLEDKDSHSPALEAEQKTELLAGSACEVLLYMIYFAPGSNGDHMW